VGIGAVIAGVRAAALRLRSHHVGAKGAPFTASRRRQAPSLFRRTVTPDRFLCPVSWSPGPPSRNKSTIFVPRFPILTSAGLRRRAPADDLPPLQALPTEFLALPGLHLPPTGPLFCAEPPRGSRRGVRAARDRLLGRPADRFRALDTPSPSAASTRCFRFPIPPTLRAATSGGPAQIIPALDAVPSPLADLTANHSGRGEWEPQQNRIEERVDEEARPQEGKRKPTLKHPTPAAQWRAGRSQSAFKMPVGTVRPVI